MLSTWACNHLALVQDDDIHNISYLSLPLGISFQHIYVVVSDNAVESVQRRGVDDLIKMAFTGRSMCMHSVLYVLHHFVVTTVPMTI